MITEEEWIRSYRADIARLKEDIRNKRAIQSTYEATLSRTKDPNERRVLEGNITGTKNYIRNLESEIRTLNERIKRQS